MTRPLAVTFDYWQTLVSERRGEMRAMQIDRWVATLAEAGQSRTEVDLTGAFAANWEVFEERWRTNAGPWGAADSVGFVGDHLGLEMSDDLRTALVEVPVEHLDPTVPSGIAHRVVRLAAARRIRRAHAEHLVADHG